MKLASPCEGEVIKITKADFYRSPKLVQVQKKYTIDWKISHNFKTGKSL